MADIAPRDAVLESVQCGAIAPLGPERVPSGFVKQRVASPIKLRFNGLEGDAQADLSVHGGPDKAVYGYGADRYALWRAAFPEHAARFVPGGVGENLTIAGQDEDSVCLGDIVGIGSAVLQVCQPRQPCFKFALRFADNRLPKAMTRNGFSGWYYRVLGEGVLQAGATVRLLERPNPLWPISRFLRVIGKQGADAPTYAELAVLPGLAAQWRDEARVHASVGVGGSARE